MCHKQSVKTMHQTIAVAEQQLQATFSPIHKNNLQAHSIRSPERYMLRLEQARDAFRVHLPYDP